jgi:hypothetical protein
MDEYGYPEAVKKGLRIVFLSASLGSTAMLAIRSWAIYDLMKVTITAGGVLPASVSTDLWREARNIVLPYAVAAVGALCAVVFVLWFFLKRPADASYSLNDTGIVRTRGRTSRSLAYREVMSVSCGVIRGLRLNARSGSMPVSLMVEAAGEMLTRLRESVTAAGGQWAEPVFDRAAMWAAFNLWFATYCSGRQVWLMALLMPIWFVLLCVSFALRYSHAYWMVWGLTSLFVLSAICVMALSLPLSGQIMFQRAWKADRRDMDGVLARRASMVSGLVTGGVLLALAAALWAIS